jgi:hypothetical protein
MAYTLYAPDAIPSYCLSERAAETVAAETFHLNDWQRKRLLLRECLSIRNEPKARS